MRARVTALLRLVPIDPRGQQALDETLADWRHEELAAASTGDRLMCNLRALAAITHTLAAITARQMIDAVQHEAAVLTYLFLWLTWLLQAALSGFLMNADPGPVRLLLWGATFSGMAVVLGAVALFLGTLSINHRRARPTPYLGLGAVAAMAVTGVAVWGMPLLHTHLRQAAFEARGGDGALLPGLNERGLIDLIASGGARELDHASLLLSLIAMCPVMTLLASAFEAASRRRRWLVGPGVPVLFVPLLSYMGGFLYHGLWFSPLVPWVLPAAGMAAAVWLRHWQVCTPEAAA